jgi:hypothetical protein
MPNLSNYPFRTARVIDGKTYIQLEELNEILENLEKLGPTFRQIADATKDLKAVFGNARRTTDNLLVEIQKEQRDA